MSILFKVCLPSATPMNIWPGVLAWWVYLSEKKMWTHSGLFRCPFTHSFAVLLCRWRSAQPAAWPPAVVIYHSDLPTSLPLLLRDSEHVIWSQQATSQPRHALHTRLSSTPVAVPFSCTACCFIAPVCLCSQTCTGQAELEEGRWQVKYFIITKCQGRLLSKDVMSCVFERF